MSDSQEVWATHTVGAVSPLDRSRRALAGGRAPELRAGAALPRQIRTHTAPRCAARTTALTAAALVSFGLLSFRPQRRLTAPRTVPHRASGDSSAPLSCAGARRLQRPNRARRALIRHTSYGVTL